MKAIALDPPAGGARVAKQPPAKQARTWWLIHQWVGLKLSILMSFVLLTGTLAVFSAEMDWLMRPALRVEAGSVQGPVNWSAITRNSAAYCPACRIQSIDAPVAGLFAASVTMRRPEGGLFFLYAHPTTGVVQGEGHWVGAERVLRNMHRHLNMPVWLGVPIVSALALLLLVSFATSLIVYKKWWRGFKRPIRTRDARTGWGDFHRLAGVWSLWFLAMIIVTSLWYLVESLGGEAPLAPRATAPMVALPAPSLAERVAAGLAAAQAAEPALAIERVQFPTDRVGAFIFEGQKSALLVRPRANAVWTSAADGQALLVTDALDLSVHQRISEAADPLHFGTFGGYWTKVPWFLFGLLLTGLSVSGATLYAMRLNRSKQLKGQSGAVLARAWRGMNVWRWPALALVLTGFALLPTLFSID
ncbi:PepSY-associated TM helix domain-containing protein [Sphingosinicella sp. LHD-64]|uniref:PepSY-associated TM helix domain-containing protein n=1 Tax=Sphingosinicella sp. LHD-64 TaxID=3072139 RepID=UPI00280F7926|nr:PepSY-associated TM helix domain-containing protein [Sphingosinicella sp. LHD-64]MDQ8755344.1 PepSY-associated TM helix domain-containing protein [Sphingosinicella sp. LHD-64]